MTMEANKQEEKEQQLREAAKRYAKECDPQNLTLEKQSDIYFGFLVGAKSEAAKAYWQFKALTESLKDGRVQELNDEVKNLKFELDNHQQTESVNLDELNRLVLNLRKNHLKHNIDLNSFKPKERIFLEIAFDAGATCMFNRLKQPQEQKQSDWISVDDRLPDVRFEQCLCFNGDAPEYNQHVFIANWFDEKKWFKTDAKFMGNITHWQPNIKPPIPNK